MQLIDIKGKEKRHAIRIDTDEMLIFDGVYRRDLEATNWHYYQTADGRILHISKRHIVTVETWELDNE